jgi:hypothetical protein
MIHCHRNMVVSAVIIRHWIFKSTISWWQSLLWTKTTIWNYCLTTRPSWRCWSIAARDLSVTSRARLYLIWHHERRATPASCRYWWLKIRFTIFAQHLKCLNFICKVVETTKFCKYDIPKIYRCSQYWDWDMIFWKNLSEILNFKF